MKAIRKELGETDPSRSSLDLEEKLAKAGMPPEVEKVAQASASGWATFPVASPEYGVIRTYLEMLCRPAVEHDHRGPPRHRRARAFSTRTTTT
jgi:ATP-dependent Lon protease